MPAPAPELSVQDVTSIIQATIAVLAFIASLIGGSYALFLFIQSNKEKRQAFVLMLYDRLYNDAEIRQLLYVLDKGKLREAVQIRARGKLEVHADKAIRLMAYIEWLIKSYSLRTQDIDAFEYELRLLNGEAGPHKEIMKNYIKHLQKVVD